MRIDGVDVALVAAFWALALWSPGSRNLRFLTFLAATSVVFVLVGALDGGLARLSRVSLAVLWVVGLCWGDRLRLGSLSPSERRFDEAITLVEDRVRRRGRGAVIAADLREAIRQLEALTPPDPDWAKVQKLMLIDLRSRLEEDAEPFAPGSVALSAAAREEWRGVRYRRVLGRRFGPGVLSSTDRRADELLATLDQQVRDYIADPPTLQREARANLIRDINEMVPPNPRWRVVFRLLGRGWLGRLSGSAGGGSTGTHPTYLEEAGRHYWDDLRTRPFSLLRRSVDAWAENVALHAYLESFRQLIPPDVLLGSPAPLGSRATESEALVQELRELRVRDPLARQIRDRLVSLLAIELRIAQGNGSESVRAEYRSAVAELGVMWARLLERTTISPLDRPDHERR